MEECLELLFSTFLQKPRDKSTKTDEKKCFALFILMQFCFWEKGGKKGKRNMGKVGPLPELGNKQMKEFSSLTGTP